MCHIHCHVNLIVNQPLSLPGIVLCLEIEILCSASYHIYSYRISFPCSRLHCYLLMHLSYEFISSVVLVICFGLETSSSHFMRVCPKVSGLATWSENCKW
jgi:hypothetical protein